MYKKHLVLTLVTETKTMLILPTHTFLYFLDGSKCGTIELSLAKKMCVIVRNVQTSLHFICKTSLQSSVKILMRAPSFCGLKDLLDLITRNGSQYTRDNRESQCEDFANSALDTRAIACTEMDLRIPDSLWCVCKTFYNL